MTSNDVGFINYKNIKNFTVDVKSEISSKNLNEFIKTSIEIELQINITNYQIFVTFIQKVNKYEIYLYQSSLKLLIPQEIFYNNVTFYSKDKYQLFICKDFFVVYLNNLFYFSKNNDNYTSADILNYLLFTYKINGDEINIHNISQEKYEDLKLQYIKYKKESMIKYIDFHTNNSYKYFLIYLCLISSFAFVDFTIRNSYTPNTIDKNNTLKDIKTKYYKALINKHKVKELKINKVISLFENLTAHNIKLISFKYEKVYFLEISTKDKRSLYSFVQIYKKQIKIKNIVNKNKIYHMDIELEL